MENHGEADLTSIFLRQVLVANHGPFVVDVVFVGGEKEYPGSVTVEWSAP